MTIKHKTKYWRVFKLFALVLACAVYTGETKGQFLMDMIDTTKDLGRGMLDVYKKFDHIRISGYMQPQYQAASDTGISSFSGGSFPPYSNNRFTLRRGRVRIDYVRYTQKNYPSIQFVFQFDGSERGVFIRDFWGRFWDTKWHLFSFSTGMFARPFGFEVNYSSSDREAPERGRMSQTLMKTERDLGAMISFEPQQKGRFWNKLKIDAGLFNGQGLSGPLEYDRFKDFIGQVYWKPSKLSPHLLVSGGLSLLYGGLRQNTTFRYHDVKNTNGQYKMVADSTYLPGSKMPRTYGGANTQIKLTHGWGATELRAEYWKGTQTGTQYSSETPGVLVTGEHRYIRRFSGAFVTFLQNIVNAKNQLILKYDVYDPNTDVSGKAITPAENFTVADIRYHTWGTGILHHFNENLKLLLYYDFVHNETTTLPGYKVDVKDNVFTCRLQFRF